MYFAETTSISYTNNESNSFDKIQLSSFNISHVFHGSNIPCLQALINVVLTIPLVLSLVFSLSFVTPVLGVSSVKRVLSIIDLYLPKCTSAHKLSCLCNFNEPKSLA